MNQRQKEHFSQQVVKALIEVGAADNGRIRLPYFQQRIRFIEDKVSAIQRVDWSRADELQELLTHVCLEETRL